LTITIFINEETRARGAKSTRCGRWTRAWLNVK